MQSDKLAVGRCGSRLFAVTSWRLPAGRSILRRCPRSTSMAQAFPEGSVIKAYWQPGCTSCLRMKEFLTKHGVHFVSINVLEDNAGFAELATLGIRSVPIVRRGKDWANGQVAGIAWD